MGTIVANPKMPTESKYHFRATLPINLGLIETETGGVALDPQISLAISMQANKGVYAALLGSGVSREAGVPTGWGVVGELIKRIASITGEEEACAPNPAEWYQVRFGSKPNYSVLIKELCSTKSERQQLLREFFEPTEEERQDNRKVPTAAHHAIAELVAKGFIRVIVTTNFDRLMEQALAARDLVPAIIASADAASGAQPLAHAVCTIIKAHGDYLDTRILNTEEELKEFDPAIDRVLDQVFDEYGLVVSGWSAEWDGALRRAIKRTPNRRYSMYWSYPRNLTDDARGVIAHRGAIEVPNTTANALFQKLAEDVASLEERATRHPLTPIIAAQTVKRYVLDPMQRIRLHDLVMEEADRVRNLVGSSEEFNVNGPYGGEVYDAWLRRMEDESAVLVAMFAVGGFWGDELNRELWMRAVARLGTISPPLGQYIAPLESLRRYPALLAMYSAGIAATGRGDIDLVVQLLTKSTITFKVRPDPLPLVLALNTSEIMDGRRQIELPGARNRTALSERIWRSAQLRDALVPMLGDDAAYTSAFDRFEYLVGLIGQDLANWAPAGCFVWRNGYYGDPSEVQVCKDLTNELDGLGEQHPLLLAGAFNKSVARLKEAKAAYDGNLRHWIGR